LEILGEFRKEFRIGFETVSNPESSRAGSILRRCSLKVRGAESDTRSPWGGPTEAREETAVPKILVVEDSNVLQMYYSQIFNQMPGYQASFTKNGRQALDHIGKNGMPDIVVLDINMPVMDGLEFLSHFRGDHQTTPAQVIIVTTEGREDDHKRGLEAGASAYLKKPFQPHMLKELVQGLLAHKARTRAGQ
jgi:CheY-like chemotaxis protein